MLDRPADFQRDGSNNAASRKGQTFREQKFEVNI